MIVILLLFGLGLFSNNTPWHKFAKENENVYYRLENYPFSWQLAKGHPFLGMGLRSLGLKFVDSYEIKYPYMKREMFSKSVEAIVASDNIFLTFMADLGFPFMIIYCFSLIVLLSRLIRITNRLTPMLLLHPLALLLPIIATVLHMQVYDGLLFPQISWFFHIFLGLIPTAAGIRQQVVPVGGQTLGVL